MKKLFALALAALSVAGTVGAQTPIKLVYYNYNLANAGLGADATREIIAQFEALHPDIKIEAPSVGQDTVARTQQDLVAGNPPDVAQLTFNSLNYIIDNFGLDPYESYVPAADLAAHLKDMHPRGVALGQRDGKTYGLAYTFSTPMLFYNADLFKQAGLDPNKPPKTWKEVNDYGRKIAQTTGAGGFQTGVYGQPYDWLLQSVVQSNGGSVLSADRKTLTFAGKETVEAVQMLRGLSLSGAQAKLTQADAQAAMAGGKLGMYLQTSALYNFLKKNAAYDLRAAAMPTFEGKTAVPTNSGSALFVITKDPARRKAAWEFVKFSTGPEAYTIITSKIGYLPLRTALADDPKYLKTFADANGYLRINLKQLDNLRPWQSYPGSNYLQISLNFMQAVEKAVWDPSDNVKALLEDAQKRSQLLMPK